MKINFTVAGVNYSADLDGTSYTLTKHGVNNAKDSEKFGKPTESVIGFYTTLANAVNKALQDSLGSKEEVTTLKEFAERVEACKAEIREQLGSI